MESIDDDWESFLQDDYGDDDLDDDVQINNRKNENNCEHNEKKSHLTDVTNIPKCSDLYISTKTKISYLNKQNIDIKKYFGISLFWIIQLLKMVSLKSKLNILLHVKRKQNWLNNDW